MQMRLPLWNNNLVSQCLLHILLTCTNPAPCHSSCRKSAAQFRVRVRLDVSGWTPAPPWFLLSLHPLLTHWAASYSHISARHSCFSTSCQPSGRRARRWLYFVPGDHSIRAGRRTRAARTWLPAKRNCLISQEVSSLLRSCSAGTASPRSPGLSWLSRDRI